MNQPVLSSDYCEKCELFDKDEATHGEGPIAKDGTPRGCQGKPAKVGTLGGGYVVWCSALKKEESNTKTDRN